MEPDDSLEVVYCNFCGTKHIIKDDIVNNTTINNNTQNIVKQYYGNVVADKDVDELISDAEMFESLGQFEKANEKYKKAIDDSPKSSRAWLGYAKSACSIPNFLEKNTAADITNAFTSAYRLSEDEGKSEVISQWMAGIQESKKAGLKYNVEYMTIFEMVDADQKDVVLIGWSDSVKSTIGGYSRLYDISIKTYGEEHTSEVLIPKWVEQIKAEIARGSSQFDPFCVEKTFEHLTYGEKERVIQALVRRKINGGDDALRTVCACDNDAVEILKSELKSSKNISEKKLLDDVVRLNKEYNKGGDKKADKKDGGKGFWRR